MQSLLSLLGWLIRLTVFFVSLAFLLGSGTCAFMIMGKSGVMPVLLSLLLVVVLSGLFMWLSMTWGRARKANRLDADSGTGNNGAPPA